MHMIPNSPRYAGKGDSLQKMYVLEYQKNRKCANVALHLIT